MDTVSVIMTVYNARPFLRQAIDSILAQTFSDFEFIIVDDGSDDGSGALIESYSDPKIRYYALPHSGRVSALNFACTVCHGDYIAIADADDISLPERMMTQLEYFERHPWCDVIGSWVRRIDSAGNSVRLVQYPISHKQIVDTMPYSCSVSFPAAMIRSKLLTDHSLFNPSYLVAHDLEFWLRILPHAHFANIPQALVQYRVGKDSLAHKYAHQAREETRALAVDYFNCARDLNEDTRLFGLARVEYYHGTLKTARTYLWRLILRSPLRIRYWRFMLVACLGQQFLTFIRSTRLSRLPGMFSRFIFSDRSLSPP